MNRRAFVSDAGYLLADAKPLRTLHDGVAILSQGLTRILAILAAHWRSDHVN
jgi:hypothetical protein